MGYFEPEKRTTDPSTATWGMNERGRCWYDIATGTFKYWNGVEIRTVSAVT